MELKNDLYVLQLFDYVSDYLSYQGFGGFFYNILFSLLFQRELNNYNQSLYRMKDNDKQFNLHGYINVCFVYKNYLYNSDYTKSLFLPHKLKNAQQSQQKIRDGGNLRGASADRQVHHHAQLQHKSHKLIQNQSRICYCFQINQHIQSPSAYSLSRQGLKIQNSQIFFQNTEMKNYMYLGTFPFNHTVYLKHQYCLDSFIKIRYKKIADSPKNSNNTQLNKTKNDQGLKQNTQPKEANKHRTIGEVVEIVKSWKKLSAQLDHQGNKIHTLASAAEVVGICKKTLQDYAYQVQFGNEFNFDFEKNNNQKIGVLRKFVKNKKKQLAFLNNTDNYWSFDGNSNSEEDLQSGTGR